MTQQNLESVSSIMGCRKWTVPWRYIVVYNELETPKNDEKDGRELFWDWEHPIKTDCIARRPGFTLEDTTKKEILLIDIVHPNEYNKIAKWDKKIGKYNRLCLELRERWEGYTVNVIPTIFRSLGGGMK